MLPLKFRLKMLNKLAQAVPTAPASPASPTSPTAPTTPSSDTAKAVQPPPSFNIASGPWAWVTRSYNAPTVGYLNTIFGMLNTLMHYSTNGEHNMVKNQNNLASVDASGAKSVDGKNAILLAQLFYKYFLNNGQPFRPHAAQINYWANTISNSQPLLNLSKLNPTGPAAQQMRLNDTFRQSILNTLGYIRQYNPVQPAR